MSELNEIFFLILLAIYEAFLEISQKTDLYQSLLILGGPISKFSKLQCVAKLKTKLMMLLPRIKADYDNYIHFNHIKRK